MLNDAHINCAQELLRSQFRGIDGLISTLYQNKVPAKRIERGVQIIHDRGNHWIVASSICDYMTLFIVYWMLKQKKLQRTFLKYLIHPE